MQNNTSPSRNRQKTRSTKGQSSSVPLSRSAASKGGGTVAKNIKRKSKDPEINHINQSTSRKTSKNASKTPTEKHRMGAQKINKQVDQYAVKSVTPQTQYVQIDITAQGQRLDNFLIGQLKGVPKTHVYRIIRSGEVRVNKARAQAQTRLEIGDEVRIPPVKIEQKVQRTPTPAREFPGLYEDDALLILNKPSGVAVHGGSGVSFGVIEQVRQARPESHFLELAHRLDRETSGVLVLAKKRSALTALQEQFRQRETGKTYLALVKGAWHETHPEASKVIRTPLHKYLNAQGERRVRATTLDDPQGKRAISIVRVVKQFEKFTLLSVTIKTGRTHQIRVHLTHAGFPIIGDDKYGDFELNKAIAKQYAFERMFLHAYRLEFEHPLTNEDLAVQAALPQECQQILQALENETTKPTRSKNDNKTV